MNFNKEIVDTRLSLISIINGSWICKDGYINKIGNQIISYFKTSRSIGENKTDFIFTLNHNLSNISSELIEKSSDYLNLPIIFKPISMFFKSNYLFYFYEKIGNNQEKLGIGLVIYGLNSNFIPFGAISNYNISNSMIHGPIMNSELYNSFDVGFIKKNIFYIAEPNIKSIKWTDLKKNNEGKNELNLSDFGNKNIYNQNWGETLEKFTSPRIYVWRFSDFNSLFNSDPYELDLNCNKNYSIFSFKLLPNELGILVNVFENEPIKLGYKFCLSRPSKLILYNLILSDITSKIPILKGGSEIIISKEDEYIRGIDILHDNNKENCKKCSVLYFSIPNNDNIPHWCSMQLCVQDIILIDNNWILSGNRRICVPLINEPIDDNNKLIFKGFSGLFGSDLYKIIPLHGTEWIFTSTYVGNLLSIVSINIITNQICKIELNVNNNADYYGNMEIYSAIFVSEESKIYASINLTSPKMPSLAMIIQIDSMKSNKNIIYANILKSISCFGSNINVFPKSLIDKSDDLELFNYTFKLAYKLNQINYFTFKDKHIVIHKFLKDKQTKSPLLLFLHGGPHSIITHVYSSIFTFFVDMGYTILIPNYSGSLGFGDKYTKNLISNIFDIELNEIISLTKDIKSFSELNIDENLCFAIGGSYGGGMIYSLITQYPTFLTSAATINGLTNAISLISTSDIPDYMFSELFKENFDKSKITILDDKELLLKLHSISPISKVDKVITPLIIAIGALDNRVPFFQSIEFYKALKKYGKSRVKMLCYSNCGHSIIQQDDILDLYLNIANWFSENNGIPFKYCNEI